MQAALLGLEQEQPEQVALRRAEAAHWEARRGAAPDGESEATSAGLHGTGELVAIVLHLHVVPLDAAPAGLDRDRQRRRLASRALELLLEAAREAAATAVEVLVTAAGEDEGAPSAEEEDEAVALLRFARGARSWAPFEQVEEVEAVRGSTTAKRKRFRCERVCDLARGGVAGGAEA